MANRKWTSTMWYILGFTILISLGHEGPCWWKASEQHGGFDSGLFEIGIWTSLIIACILQIISMVFQFQYRHSLVFFAVMNVIIAIASLFSSGDVLMFILTYLNFYPIHDCILIPWLLSQTSAIVPLLLIDAVNIFVKNATSAV